MKWWNNGVTNTRSETCPDGYVAGRLHFNRKSHSPKTKSLLSKKLKGRIPWNKGKITDDTEYKKYKRECILLTEQNYRKSHEVINPLHLKRERYGYHLDHIVAIKYGYIHDIPIEEIAAVSNLRMLFWRDDISKGWK